MELMFYLIFSSILLGIIGQAYHSITKASFLTFEKYNEEIKLNTLKQIITQAIYKNSFNAFLPSYHWHSQGNIPLYIQNKIDTLTPSSKPVLDAAILEIAEIFPVHFIKSKNLPNVFLGTSENIIHQLSKIKGLYSPEPLNSYRFLGKPFLKHLKGNEWELFLDSTATPNGETILTSDIAVTYSTPILLLPLTDHYILFTTSDNTLRRISLISSENQPLLDGISLFSNDQTQCVAQIQDAKHTKPEPVECVNMQVNAFKRAYAIDL